jgi:outer membrane protein TolC
MIRRILFLLIPFGLSTATFAQEAMSLADCIEYALVNHQEVHLAQLSMRDADWQIKENRAAAYPHFSLGLNANRYIQQPALPAEALGFEGAPAGTKVKFALENTYSGTITYDQLLFNSDYIVSLKAAKLYRQYAELQYRTVVERVRDKVNDAYLPALVLSESISVLDRNITNQELLLKETKATYATGFVEQLDVDRVDYVVSTLKTLRESQVRQRDMMLDNLKFTMNMPLATVITLSDDIDKLLADYDDIDPEEALNYMNRPQYPEILKLRELSQVQIEIYQKDWLPKLSFFANYNPSFQGGDELFWIPSALIGFSLTMPIYDGGYSDAKEERAIVSALKVDEQKSTIMRALDLQVETARKQYANNKQKVADQEHNVALAQRIHDTAQAKFKEGVGSSFEVTQAQTSLLQAENILIQSRFDYLQSIVDLRKALGKI